MQCELEAATCMLPSAARMKSTFSIILKSSEFQEYGDGGDNTVKMGISEQ